MQPPSPAVSHGSKSYNMNGPSASLAAIIRIRVHVPCTCIVAMPTIQGQHLCHSEFPIMRLLFEGDIEEVW